MRVYVAGPIFTPDARERVVRISEAVRAAGHAPIVPFSPEDPWPGPDGPDDPAAREAAFARCLDGVRGADALVAVLDGPDADSGTAFEVGYARARGIPVLGLRTDCRTLGPEGIVNLMLALGVSALSHRPDGWDAALEDVKGFLASPPERGVEALVRDKVPTNLRAAGKEPAVRKLDGSAYASALKRKIVEAAEGLLAAEDSEDEKASVVDALEAVEALIAHRAFAKDALRRAKERRVEEDGGFRLGYVIRT